MPRKRGRRSGSGASSIVPLDRFLHALRRDGHAPHAEPAGERRGDCGERNRGPGADASAPSAPSASSAPTTAKGGKPLTPAEHGAREKRAEPVVEPLDGRWPQPGDHEETTPVSVSSPVHAGGGSVAVEEEAGEGADGGGGGVVVARTEGVAGGERGVVERRRDPLRAHHLLLVVVLFVVFFTIFVIRRRGAAPELEPLGRAGDGGQQQGAALEGERLGREQDAAAAGGAAFCFSFLAEFKSAAAPLLVVEEVAPEGEASADVGRGGGEELDLLAEAPEAGKGG